MLRGKSDQRDWKTHTKDNSSNSSFGPSLGISRPIEMKNNYKKLIHYDCNPSNDNCDDEDIPEENEVYIKENLLYKKREEPITEQQDDDFSIVNINVSKLMSSSGSGSKNSFTFNCSNHTNTKQSPNVIATGNNTSSSYSKKGGISSNSIESNKQTKKSITMKRKANYDKLMKNQKMTDPSQDLQSQVDENELRDVMNDCDFSNDNNNKSTNPNVKITNITNIIFNVKNYGKSFDVHRVSATPNAKDTMMKDMKSLHLITQKALTTKSKGNPVDSFDDERTSFLNFRNTSKNHRELYISDNSDLHIGNELHSIDNSNSISKRNSMTSANEPNESKQSIINIININSNYSIDNISSVTKPQKKPLQSQKYMNTEPAPCDSFRSSKAKNTRLIPKANNIKGLPVKDFISAIKDDKKVKKGKFISVGLLKK